MKVCLHVREDWFCKVKKRERKTERVSKVMETWRGGVLQSCRKEAPLQTAREREVKHCICVCGLLETAGTRSRRRQPFHRPHRTIQPFCESITPLSPLRIRRKVFLLPKPLFCLFIFMEHSSRKLNMQKFVFDDIEHKG